MILDRCLLHPTPWVVCFTVSKFQVNRLRRLPLSSQIRWADFNICMHVACRFTGDTVAYTLPSSNRPQPTRPLCCPLSFQPLGGLITQNSPFASHNTTLDNVVSKSSNFNRLLVLPSLLYTTTCDFLLWLPPIDLLQNQFCRGVVPKRPTPVLHLQLSLWPLLLVTVHTASTSLLVPASFLTRYSTNKTQRNNDRTGREAIVESHAQTHVLQSSKQLPSNV